MVERTDGVMPAASPGGGRRRSLATVVAVGLAAVLGAVVVVAVWPPDDRDPAPQASTPAPAGAGASPGGAVSGCVGGSDPVQAVLAGVQMPATLDGAAEAAAAVVRWSESKAFGEPNAGDTITRIGDSLGSPDLRALQRGQAAHVARMTSTTARPERGAYAVTPEPLAPTVTVLVPVQWSTGAAQHHEWRFVDVRLARQGERWAVLDADTTGDVGPELRPLRGAEVRAGDLDRYELTLMAGGFRRYGGDC